MHRRICNKFRWTGGSLARNFAVVGDNGAVGFLVAAVLGQLVRVDDLELLHFSEGPSVGLTGVRLLGFYLIMNNFDILKLTDAEKCDLGHFKMSDLGFLF